MSQCGRTASKFTGDGPYMTTPQADQLHKPIYLKKKVGREEMGS